MTVWQRDHIVLGLIMGLLIPFVGYALLLVLLEELQSVDWLMGSNGQLVFRTRTTLLVAICLNLIPFSIYQRRRKAKTMRGILSATLIYSVAWIIYFGSTVFQSGL